MPPPPAGRAPRPTSQHLNVLEPLPAVAPVAPLLSFDNIGEYMTRHRDGVNVEFEFEKREVQRFNAAMFRFKAYPLIAMRHGDNSKDILLFVEPKDHDSMLPKEDDRCKMDIPGVGILDATRKENPCTSWGVRSNYWDRHLVFEITLPSRSGNSIIPFFSGPEIMTSGTEMPRENQVRYKNVTFELRLSYSTMKAEIAALEDMEHAVTENQVAMQNKSNVMKYILDFRSPTNFVNLFTVFPHMMSPDTLPRHVSPELAQNMRDLNTHQQTAYRSLLSNLPARIGILPGGPGAGKKHFITVLVAALQSTDEMIFPGESVPRPHRNTTLLLCDINKPATDIANKFHQLYRQLRLTRRDPGSGQDIPRVVVRMYCWSYEKKSLRRDRLEAEGEELLRCLARGDRNPMSGANGFAGGPETAYYDSAADNSELVDVQRFSVPFLRAGTSSAATVAHLQDSNVAPTLDQFARADYEANKHTEYSRLRTMLSGVDTENFDMTTVVSFAVESEIEEVYRNALRKIDVLVTTPVTAAKFQSALSNMFSPALVIFDEAPHAREASTLIAIANFNPEAWIFTGDHRQMKPWVGSSMQGHNINRNAPQLRVSMMERAYRVSPEGPALMLNHRACGNLHQLPSMIFYDNRMISAYDEGHGGLLPPSARHLRESYIMPMKRNNGPMVSRLLVVLDGIGRPTNIQSSWYHRGHQHWVKELVSKLLQDRDFRQVNGGARGTVLIMSPYKTASIEYRKMIKELRTGSPGLDTSSVGARTVDTAQGFEADCVILDLVRDRATDYLDDPNRLCVALTRARQAEIILMHKDMLRRLRGNGVFSGGPLAQIVRHCEQAGEFVHGPASI